MALKRNLKNYIILSLRFKTVTVVAFQYALRTIFDNAIIKHLLSVAVDVTKFRKWRVSV